jgi:hypothetical protein
VLVSQYQAPVTGLEVHSWMDRSTADRCRTGRLKVRMIGIPTP